MSTTDAQQMKELLGWFKDAWNNQDLVDMANLASRCIQDLSGDKWQMDHCGVCPHCFKWTCLHVGRDEWYVCHEHRFRGYVGSKIFSSWREMTEAQFVANAELLSTYADVTPLHMPRRNRAHAFCGRSLRDGEQDVGTGS